LFIALGVEEEKKSKSDGDSAAGGKE
jgi:hypothetical protein